MLGLRIDDTRRENGEVLADICGLSCSYQGKVYEVAEGKRVLGQYNMEAGNVNFSVVE